jgi:ureidoglycolate lyase
MRTLVPAPLTAAAFAPFGEVIEAEAARALVINQGHTIRYDDLALLDVTDAGGAPCISRFRSTPMRAPIVLRLMERHPLGSQAFIPLERRPFLVAVAPPGAFDAAKICVFLARGDQGVNYGKGVWHHFLLALGGVSDFLVIDRKGPGENCDEVMLSDSEMAEVKL